MENLDLNDVNKVYTLCLKFLESKQYSNFLRYIFNNIDKNHVESILLLVDYFSCVKQFDEAIYYWKKGIDLGSNKCIIGLGKYYTSQNKLDDAISIYRIGVAKNDVSSIVLLGCLYYDQIKDYDNAFEIWSLGIPMENPSCLHNIGLCYEIKNDIQNALDCWIRSGNMGLKNSIKKLSLHYNEKNNTERYIYWLNKLDEKDKLIKSICTYLNINENIEVTKDFLEVLSNLKEKDFKDIPLYLRVIIRLLTQKLERILVHCEYKPNGCGYNEVKNEYLKVLSIREPTDKVKDGKELTERVIKRRNSI